MKDSTAALLSLCFYIPPFALPNNCLLTQSADFPLSNILQLSFFHKLDFLNRVSCRPPLFSQPFGGLDSAFLQNALVNINFPYFA